MTLPPRAAPLCPPWSLDAEVFWKPQPLTTGEEGRCPRDQPADIPLCGRGGGAFALIPFRVPVTSRSFTLRPGTWKPACPHWIIRSSTTQARRPVSQARAPLLRNSGSHHDEKPAPHEGEQLLLAATRGSSWKATMTQCSQT